MIKRKQFPKFLSPYCIAFEKSVGAVVFRITNGRREYLLMKYRNGHWEFPRGKVEDIETELDTMRREIEEETGISVLKIIKRLNDSWHIYPWKNDMVIKKTCWFLMYSDYDNKLIPQLSEDITDVKWLPVEDAKKALNNSYRSLKENISIP
jgi:8-oxo-dGTP pyrophosphatase MutT (NUDIX family)